MNIPERLSEHLTFAEGIASTTAKLKGISNMPTTQKQIDNMKFWAVHIYEVIRNHFRRPVGLSSFLRVAKLNALIGGSDTSQHCEGEAGDLDGDIYGSPSNKEIFEFARDKMVFDQMIVEGISADGKIAWVHISIKANGQNRQQILFMYRVLNGKVVNSGGVKKYEAYSLERYKVLVK